ncbi:uncharacterized protein LOC131155375 isoform X4 [Malania oleifera]|uniref:uncharacterized protein LOC131155375 isoform X4 n=2 Tax=Malania oleifera TaxID=397392 RepID=UPI0025ADC6AF|nr:uncharacterized protein LOC131155375 isoform X4 [Malania oleifera]
MCGRARCTLRADDIPRACYLNTNSVRTVHMDRYRPSSNVPPGSYLPVVRIGDGSDGQGAVVHCMRWGLVPSFTKKTEKPNHYRMFNARSESIHEKSSFRRLVPNSRCLVAVEGFYEWKKDGSKKQPYYIHFKDGRPLVFAALYDSWENFEDRMPVIFGDKGSAAAWLYGSSSSKFDMLLKPYEEPDLGWYPVTPAVGNPSFDGPECIKEIQLKTEDKNSITQYFSKKDNENERELTQAEDPFIKPVRTNQIQLKTEEKNSITKYFPKKENENERELTQAEDPFKKSVRTNQVKSLRVETVDTRKLACSAEEAGDDSKSTVSVLHHERDLLFHPKRDYEEFSADSYPAIYNCNDKCSPRKKGNFERAGDKQPKFSYFGKR